MKNRDEEVFEKLLKQQLRQTFTHQESPCPDENLVSAYLEGTLSAELTKNLEKHAADCSRCREEMALWLKIREEGYARGLTTQCKLRKPWPRDISWTWMQQLTYKPILALLVVAILSSYLGWRVVRQNEILKEQEANRSSTLSEPAPAVTEPPSIPTGDSAISREMPAGVRSHAAGYPTPDTLKDKKSDFERKGDPISPPAPPPPEPLQKPADDSMNQIFSQEKRPEGSALQSPPESIPMVQREEERKYVAPRPIGGVVAPSRVPAIPQEAPKSAHTTDENLPGKAHPTAESAKKESAEDLESDALRHANERGDSLQLASPDSIESLNRTIVKGQRTVGNKQFEFRNGCWIDLAIPNPVISKAVITYRNSFEAQQLMNRWPESRRFFEEKEDFLIKLGDKLYLIKTSPPTP